MKSRNRIIAIALLCFMLPCFALPSSAMAPSLPTYVQGSRSYGVLFPRECGIVIEGQIITYDIPTLPVIDSETMVVEEYTGSVTTEYTLYNPTDSEITLGVILPLSQIPIYNYGYQEPDVTKYVVTTNGRAVDGFGQVDTPYDDRGCVEYDYEIVIPPVSRIVHTVTAPIYPEIETAYEPPTYFYEYTLYAENAALFSGDIKVNINTPYYIIPNEYYAFEKTEGGYSLTMPASESYDDGTGYIAGGVFFTLCESENPEKNEVSLEVFGTILIILLIIFLPMVIVYAITWGMEQIVNTVIGWFR